MLLVVVVVAESLTCDGKYFCDQLAVRWEPAGPGWRNYLAVGKYWCKLTGPHHHHHHQQQEGRGKHLYPSLPPLYIIIAQCTILPSSPSYYPTNIIPTPSAL